MRAQLSSQVKRLQGWRDRGKLFSADTCPSAAHQQNVPWNSAGLLATGGDLRNSAVGVLGAELRAHSNTGCLGAEGPGLPVSVHLAETGE